MRTYLAPHHSILNIRNLTTEMKNHREEIHIKKFPLCGEIQLFM